MNQGARDANEADYRRAVKAKLDRIIELLEQIVDARPPVSSSQENPE